MNINAKYFGSISYTDKDPIHVIHGLFGFESYTYYLPIPFTEYDDSMISLQSLEDESLSVIFVNTFGIFTEYKTTISTEDLNER